jgi:Amt family ammonium transporter
MNAIPGHSLTLAALGVFILWFAWFGFSGCATINATGDDILVSMSNIFITTNLAAATATTAVMVLTWIRYGKPDVSMTLNSTLAGLVAITAGCDLVSPTGAFFIGLIAGIVVVYSVEFIDQKLHIDDPVGAISVHGICGGLGTILAGCFAVKNGLLYTGNADFLLVQVIGVIAVAVYVITSMSIVFALLSHTIGLRVTHEEEIQGLDFEEHSLSPVSENLISERNFITTTESSTTFATNNAAPDTSSSANHPSLSRISIVTSQDRFEPLRIALENIGITGMTVKRALGYGLQKGHKEMYRGATVASKLLPKVQCDVVVSKIPPRTIIETAKKALHTGKYGDGKIFISTVDNVVKIRTGEEGYDALQDTSLN